MRSMMPVLPSGRQYGLRLNSLHAVVTEVGAGLRALGLGDWEVLDGYAEDEMCPAAHGAVLMPWPNRLEDGHYVFEGQAHDLPLTEPGRRNAIHGLVRWLSWEARDQGPSHAVMGLVLHPQPGYPFSLDLEVHYGLGDDGLTVTTSARNVGAGPLPFGAGHHPYFTLGGPRIDGAWLRLPGGARLETDERLNATGRVQPVDGTEYDFRSGRVLGTLALDTAYTDLVRDPDGRSRVELRADAPPRRLTLWMDAEYRYLMAFTGDTLGEPRRRRGLALEPMTCGPNAFRRPGLGLRVLLPGEQVSCSWGLTL